MWLHLWAPVVFYAAAIFYVSSMSQPPGVPGPISDKWLHAVAYAGLAWLLARALSLGRPERVTWQMTAGAVLLASAYGATDEWHQAFVPGRLADVRDFMADAVGAGLGAVAHHLVAQARRRRSVRRR